MSQIHLPVGFSETDIQAIDDAIAVLEQKFAPLLGLSADERQLVAKIIEKSRDLYHHALVVAALNPEIIPDHWAHADDGYDFGNIDRLPARLQRLHQLLDKVEEGGVPPAA